MTTTAMPATTIRTYAPGTTNSRRVNGHTITITAGPDSCYTLRVHDDGGEHDAWGHNYGSNLTECCTEANRIHNLIAQHGSITAVEQLTEKLTDERAEIERRRRHNYSSTRTVAQVDQILDQLITPADKALLTRLIADTTRYLTQEVPA